MCLCVFNVNWCSPVRLASKRVFLFTNNDDPHSDSVQLQVCMFACVCEYLYEGVCVCVCVCEERRE